MTSSSFQEIYRAHYGLLRHFIRKKASLSPEQIEDLIQESFLQLFKNQKKVPPEEIRTYLLLAVRGRLEDLRKEDLAPFERLLDESPEIKKPDDQELEAAFQRFMARQKSGRRPPLSWLSAAAGAALAIFFIMKSRELPPPPTDQDPSFAALDLLQIVDVGTDLEVRISPNAHTFVLLSAQNASDRPQLIWKGAALEWPQPGILIAKPLPERLCLLQGSSSEDLDAQFAKLLEQAAAIDPKLCVSLKAADAQGT